MIVKEEDLQKRKYDPPFLNRFEKHRFKLSDNLSEQDQQLRDELQEWLTTIGSLGGFEPKDLIPSLTENTVLSLAFKYRNHPHPLSVCKDNLIWLFSWDGALRASTQDPEIFKHFLEIQEHKTIQGLY